MAAHPSSCTRVLLWLIVSTVPTLQISHIEFDQKIGLVRYSCSYSTNRHAVTFYNSWHSAGSMKEAMLVRKIHEFYSEQVAV